MAITQERLKELFTYENGELLWKENKGNVKAGEKAGETPDEETGYRKVMVDGISYRLHRLIWAFHFGVTTDSIKFYDNDRTHTSIENLRQVTKQEIMQTRHKFKNSSSEHKGVYFNKKTKKWVAQVKHQNKTLYIGSFVDELSAHVAWSAKVAQLRNFELFERDYN